MGPVGKASLCVIALAPLCAILAGSSRPSADVPAGRRIEVPARYLRALARECRAHGVPLRIAAALVERESGWRPRAVGRNRDGTRDYGLMQLNSAYLEEFSWRYRKGLPFDPLDAFDNMAIGVEHLATLRRHAWSWRGALAAYNCGLARYLDGRAPPESREYARSIIGEGR